MGSPAKDQAVLDFFASAPSNESISVYCDGQGMCAWCVGIGPADDPMQRRWGNGQSCDLLRGWLCVSLEAKLKYPIACFDRPLSALGKKNAMLPHYVWAKSL